MVRLSKATIARIAAAVARIGTIGQDVDEATMPSRATIQAPIKADDGRGGKKTVYQTLLDGVPCEVQTPNSMSAQESVIGDRMQTLIPFIVKVPLETPMQASYRLVIDNAQTLEVVALLGPTSYGSSLRVLCKEAR